MTNKPKLLWIGDIVAKTGFARVTENVLPFLKCDFDITVLGNNWWGDPSPLQQVYTMYPSSNRFQTAPFGEERIREIVMKIKPDIIFTINDMWIVNEQYKQIQDMHKDNQFKFVGYVPMDSYNWVGCLTDTANDWNILGVLRIQYILCVNTVLFSIHKEVEYNLIYFLFNKKY